MVADHRFENTELRLNQIDLNLLRVFDVMMQERSVTRTAQLVGRTQSSISHSIARLRELFNDELFIRDGRQMVPTPWALDLAPGISTAMSGISRLVGRNISFDALSSIRHFRIGLSDYTAVALLPLLIERFTRSAPSASLSILHTREAEVPKHLRSREVDCVVIGNPSLTEAHLVQEVLCADKMVCAGWKGNPTVSALTFEKYLAADHLQISADGVAEGAADIVLRKMGRSRKVIATVPHYLVAPWIIKSTQLITVFGDSVVPALTSMSETVIVPPPLPLPDVSLTMIYERYLEADLGHAWLRQLIRGVASEQAAAKKERYREVREVFAETKQPTKSRSSPRSRPSLGAAETQPR